MIATLALFLSLLQSPEAEAPPPAARVPATSLVHVELPSASSWSSAAAGSRLLAILRDEETVAFLEPTLEAVRADLRYLTRDEDGLLELLEGLEVEGASFTLIAVRLEPVDDEDASPAGDGFDPERDAADLLVTARLPGHAEEVFDRLQAKALESEPESTVVEEIAGRRSFHTADDQDPYMAFLLEGDLLALAMGRAALDAFLESPQEPLADDEGYRAVLEALDVGPGSAFAWVDVPAMLELIGRGIERSMAWLDEDRAELTRRALTEDPTYAPVEALGWAVTPDGELLVDRMHVRAPGERSGWSSARPIGDAPRRHAALCDPESDLFWSTTLDVREVLAQARAERERLEALHAELHFDPPEEELDLAELADALEAAEIDVEGELLPSLGHGLSFAVSLPEGGGMSLPDLLLVLDLADAAAFEALLERAVEAELPGLALRAREHAGRRVVQVQLVNAGLPVVPAACVAGDRLLVALTPQSLEAQLARVDAADSLVAAPAFAGWLEGLDGSATSALWMDVGGTYQYLYSMVGVVLGVMRMQGAEVSDRFDPSLLPSGERLGELLGTGSMVVRHDDAGVTVEGRSALGNPLVGLSLATFAIGGLIAASEALHEEVLEEQRRESEERMRALVGALEAYRDSVGGGSFPEDLAQLVDRGLLDDAAQLVDPADPAPRKVRTGTGERLPVSYALGRADALPDDLRRRLRARNAELVLYTRGAWYETGGEPARLAVAVDADARVRRVKESDWGR